MKSLFALSIFVLVSVCTVHAHAEVVAASDREPDTTIAKVPVALPVTPGPVSPATSVPGKAVPATVPALPGANPAARVPGVPDDASPPLSFLPSDDNLIDPKMARSWGAAPARLFISTNVDVGWVYLRPRVSLGYGKPFTSWFGVDVNPVASSAAIGAYAGVRFALPAIELRVGSRFMHSFQRSYLAPMQSYGRLDLDASTFSAADVLTHEAELTAVIPAGPGDVLLVGSASIVTGVPAGQYVFEESLHAIVNPPLIWRARVGYSLRFGALRQHSIGLVAEVLDVPNRADSVTLRSGPVLRISLSRRVEVRGSFVMTLISPDQIGLVGSDFTELGVRYRWASE